MTKFTDGPWIKNKYGELVGVKGKSVSTYASGLSSRMSDPDEETVANTHLIAAAPDMYEALEVVLNELDQDHLDEPDEMVINGRAALAKARGEI